MITFKELKNVLSVNKYTLIIDYGCDFERVDSLDLVKSNDLYHAFDNCIVESVDIYDNPADNEIRLHSLNYDDDSELYFDAVTCEELPAHIQNEIKGGD